MSSLCSGFVSSKGPVRWLQLPYMSFIPFVLVILPPFNHQSCFTSIRSQELIKTFHSATYPQFFQIDIPLISVPVVHMWFIAQEFPIKIFRKVTTTFLLKRTGKTCNQDYCRKGECLKCCSAEYEETGNLIYFKAPKMPQVFLLAENLCEKTSFFKEKKCHTLLGQLIFPIHGGLGSAKGINTVSHILCYIRLVYNSGCYSSNRGRNVVIFFELFHLQYFVTFNLLLKFTLGPILIIITLFGGRKPTWVFRINLWKVGIVSKPGWSTLGSSVLEKTSHGWNKRRESAPPSSFSRLIYVVKTLV